MSKNVPDGLGHKFIKANPESTKRIIEAIENDIAVLENKGRNNLSVEELEQLSNFLKRRAEWEREITN